MAITILSRRRGRSDGFVYQKHRNGFRSPKTNWWRFYLGQEVFEYVRNVRGHESYKREELAGRTGQLQSKRFGWLLCRRYKNPVAVTDCGTVSCSNKLKFDGQNYNYTSGDEVAFSRSVKIDDSVQGVGGDEAKITVSVKWTGKYGEKTMNLQDNIFNWR